MHGLAGDALKVPCFHATFVPTLILTGVAWLKLIYSCHAPRFWSTSSLIPLHAVLTLEDASSTLALKRRVVSSPRSSSPRSPRIDSSRLRSKIVILCSEYLSYGDTRNLQDGDATCYLVLNTMETDMKTHPLLILLLRLNHAYHTHKYYNHRSYPPLTGFPPNSNL